MKDHSQRLGTKVKRVCGIMPHGQDHGRAPKIAGLSHRGIQLSMNLQQHGTLVRTFSYRSSSQGSCCYTGVVLSRMRNQTSWPPSRVSSPLRTVGKALREQWSDSDLAKRDKQKGQSACFVDQEDQKTDEALLGEEDALLQ